MQRAGAAARRVQEIGCTLVYTYVSSSLAGLNILLLVLCYGTKQHNKMWCEWIP